MEDIKSNIEKIFAQYSDSITHAVPKKLIFTVNDSFENSAKKRKHSASEVNENGMKKTKSETSDANISLNSFIESSPWESRRMKADLIEARTLILQLKSELDHQNKVRDELEILYKSKIDSLRTELDHSTFKITDMEKHLMSVRKREFHQRDDLNKVKMEMTANKQKYEEKLNDLEKKNHEMKEDFHLQKSQIMNDQSEMQRQMMKTEQMLKTLEKERETINELCEELQLKSYKYDDLEKDFEIQIQKISKLESHIKELEYEIESYGEWKNTSQTAQARLINISDLEKDNVRFRQEARNLRESVGNKLLLEEQVYDLKSRLESTEQNCAEITTYKVQLASMETELKNWRAVAADHCPANTAFTPQNLRNCLENILQKDLILSNEKSSAKNEYRTMQDQLIELKAQNEIYTKNNNDQKIILKRHQTIIHKMQKKLTLVAGERDCYKRLLDNYEKDLTISGPQSQNNANAQLQMRIEMLERTVNGYKEMCANLEREVQNFRIYPEVQYDTANSDSYEKLRSELTNLKVENEKMKKRKDELELELENWKLKGEYNQENYKIVHFTANPASEAYEENRNEVERLQVDVERLKRKIRKLEENEQEMTLRLNDTNITLNIKEINGLKSQIQSLEAKNNHIKEVYKSASQEFREVVYMLFGYRIDRIGNKNYRISSVYAESEDEYLNFRINDLGVLDMLETDFSVSLAEMMRTHLGSHNSLPAFLSSLTLDLFNKVTVIS